MSAVHLSTGRGGGRRVARPGLLLRALVVCLTVVSVLTACSSHSSDARPGTDVPTPPTPTGRGEVGDSLTAESTITRTVISGQAAAVEVPRSPNGTLVLWFHGYGENSTTIIEGELQSELRIALVNEGYSVAASDGGGPAAWGNAASVTAYLRALKWAQQESGASKVVLLGQSMGGLASLQMVSRLPQIVGWVGIFPVCNLSTVLPRFPSIPTAWGVETWGAGEAVPLSPVSPSYPRGFPILIVASPGDTVVPKASNADPCADAATAAGARVTVASTTGDHGDPSAFRPSRILTFLESAVASSPLDQLARD